MTFQLRQRHRVMIFALSVVVPAAFAVGIATRKAVPAMSMAAPSAVTHYQEIWSRDDLWETKSIRTRLLRDGAAAGQLAVGLISKDPIVSPDVLVYWVPGERKILASLSEDAFFLGSFDLSNPVPLDLPSVSVNQAGALVLYSLADQQLLAVSKVFAAK